MNKMVFATTERVNYTADKYQKRRRNATYPQTHRYLQVSLKKREKIFNFKKSGAVEKRLVQKDERIF